MKPLGVVKYYGGKAKMSELIVSLLDYKTSDIYIEPFGGGARVLLNKPRHTVEIYNDSSAGMVALFELLSSKDTAFSLIRRLYDTEYSEEYFERALRYRNQIEDNYLQEEIRQIRKLLLSIDKERGTKMFSDFNRRLRRVYEYEPKGGNNDELKYVNIVSVPVDNDTERQIKETLANINICIDNYIKNFDRMLDEDEERDITEQTRRILTYKGINIDKDGNSKEAKRIYRRLYNNKLKEIFMGSAENYGTGATDKTDIESGVTLDDKMELAACTYVVYMQSRDGAGVAWGDKLYRTNDAYLRTIDKLYDVVHRLDGVNVFQIDAYMFFVGETGLSIEFAEGFNRWNTENVMMYLDPTYLQEGKTNNSSSDKRNVEEYNPGIRYKHYWTYEQHETFLRCIQQAKCKILLSNYDDSTHLYKRYLEEGYGLEGDELKNFKRWNRLEYETVTTMAQNQSTGRERTECLWYNY